MTRAWHEPGGAFTPISMGHVIFGRVLSTTTTVWVHVLVLPTGSVTVQSTFVEPSWKVGGALFSRLSIEQLSDTTGVPKATVVAEQVALAFSVTVGGQVISGAITSSTTTFVATLVALQPFPSITSTK